MVKLKINDNYYRLIDGYNIQESSREVKFSNLILDFTEKTIADLPLKYQECQLVDVDIDDVEESDGQEVENTNFQINYDKRRNFEFQSFKGQTTQNGTPTPTAPVPINVVSGRQTVSIVGGKNIFNKENVINDYRLDASGNPYANVGYSLSGYINVEPSTTYCRNKTLNTNQSVAFYKQDGTFIQRITSGTSFTTTSATYYIRTSISTSELDTTQIEKGSTSTTYEAFIGNSYEINLGKNLYQVKVPDYTAQQAWSGYGGANYTMNTDGFTFTSRYSSVAYEFDNLDSGTPYIVSFDAVANLSVSMGVGVNVYNGSTESNKTAQTKTVTTTKQRFFMVFTAYTTNRIAFHSGNNASLTDLTISNIQIEKGAEYTQYTPYKTPIELCKIGNYQDFIRKGTGKNLFNGNFEIGSFSNTGINASATTRIRTVDYIPVEENTSYTISYIKNTTNNIQVSVSYYDKNDYTTARLSYLNWSTTYPLTFTTPSGCKYVRFLVAFTNNSTISTTDIVQTVQLEKGSTATLYEPYGYNGKWYLTKYVGKVVLNGSQNITLASSGVRRFNATYTALGLTNIKDGTGTYDTAQYRMCDHFRHTSSTYNAQKWGTYYTYNGWLVLYDTDTVISDANALKTWFTNNPTTIHYVLATPTTTEITDTELISQLESIELLNGLNNIGISTPYLPMIMKLHYNFNEAYQILTLNDNIYTGYVNNFTLPSMKNKKEYRELELELLSPLAMATLRTTDVIGTYALDSLIRMILVPLINDGFVLKEMNVGSSYVSVNYQTETIESALNKLSNKFNFWWYIDKNKNIYINSISYIMAKSSVFNYNEQNKIDGLIDFTPSVSAGDYCNAINFSNVRMYVPSYYYKYYEYNPETEQYDIVISESVYPLLNVSMLNPGDEVEFNMAIDISKENILKCYDEISYNINLGRNALYIAKMVGSYLSTPVLQMYLDEDNNLVIPNNVSIEDSYSENKEFVLVRDSFFPNLIVGMKYNGSETIDIANVTSISSLAWVKLRILDNAEIKRNEDKISKTGIVEKQIDLNEQWKFYNELLEIANSYMKKNTPNVEEIKMKIDKNYNFNIGDTITIDRIEYFTKGTFIITDKQIVYNNNITSYIYTLRNTNILESYVDLFRANEVEELQDKQYILISSNYVEEKVIEKLEVSKDEN